MYPPQRNLPTLSHPNDRFGHLGPYPTPMTPQDTFSSSSALSIHGQHRPSLEDEMRPLNREASLQHYNLSMVPRQFAFPVPHQGSQDAMNDVRFGLSFTEHALRRKTPNGTIAAGFDATPVDRAIQLPAAKHILVSSLPEQSHNPTPRTGITPEIWQQNGVVGNPRSHPHYATSWYNDDSDDAAAAAGNRVNSALRSARSAADYHNSWTFPGGLDSVLNQTLPMQPSQRYYLQNGSNVPTVLPATLHAFPGPTASEGSEFYGPYWPDGSFVPYRPAPVRHPRYDLNLAHDSAPGSSGNLHSNNHRPGFRGFLAPLTGINTDSSGPSSTGIGGFDHLPNQPFVSSGRQPPLAFETLSNSTSTPQHQAQYFPPGSSRSRPPAPLRDIDASLASWDVSCDFRKEPANVMYREKVFRLAHSAYVDLLASIHQPRKSSPHKSESHPRRVSKPSIYPKPPRQPGSDFSAQYNEHDQDLLDQQRSKVRIPNSHSQSHENPLRPGTITFSPSRRSSHQSENRPRTGHAFDRVQSFSGELTGKFSTTRRSSGSSLSQLSLLEQDASSAQTRAGDALDMIEVLCNESENAWVDGMLLGGCLAYGLTEYNKAMEWYKRVLAQDAVHVEAMSNLAATLLALNRREEALSYWMEAVRLRPSYFEAVEHLIGLLCSFHRVKEAVSTIELVEQSLRQRRHGEYLHWSDTFSEGGSDTKSRSSSIATLESVDRAAFDYDECGEIFDTDATNNDILPLGFGSSGFTIPGSENNRILALIHAKGNMLYALGDNQGAAAAFEDAILIAAGRCRNGIRGLIRTILSAFTNDHNGYYPGSHKSTPKEPILLLPQKALQTAKLIFPPHGNLPGLEFVPTGLALKAAISITSNSLLSLAKIYQDGMSNTGVAGGTRAAVGVREILALYYLSLALQPSPSTANNVGILFASVQQTVPQRRALESSSGEMPSIPGVVPGSGIALALAYYNYGLNLDQNHAHLYTNLGSLLKDIGQLAAAIRMYEHAVQCDGNFDIALANLANAVKDQGRVAEAIGFYKRAVRANPNFAEAVCGLATALNSVCGWEGRGGVYADLGKRDRFHVDEKGMLLDAREGSGWINRVVEIVERQLKDGESWGRGTITPVTTEILCQQLTTIDGPRPYDGNKRKALQEALQSWSGQKWEGSRIVRLVERAIRSIGWQWYQDRYRHRKDYGKERYLRPALPGSLSSPCAPTVLPFHTFTAPLSAKQIRQISHRNGLRISVSTLRSPWLPSTVYPPPAPPDPQLNVGYVSSDFNNHPLAHLMQSVFGLHNPSHVRAFCYATTSSDGSIHRQQIEREAPVFCDASTWSVEKLVNKIVADGIHILINLNGYTRGARNEVFAARPAPIHMSFMGFAGTLGAEWCDYILADEIAVPQQTLCPWRRNVDVTDRIHPDSLSEDAENWIYSENIIFAKASFFCCDHKQSAPDAGNGSPPLGDRHGREKAWEDEQARRWKLRKDLFPSLTEDAVILGNFNQLYKIDPSTFRLYLRILSRLPNAILWLLRFPDLGEQNLLNFAHKWAGSEIASRIIFTDVAPKGMHIIRASVVDLFLDTPECNAHTTAADVVWSGTPIVTWGRWDYKMCSRMAGSIVASALPLGREGDKAREDLLVKSEAEYEDHAIQLAGGLKYPLQGSGKPIGRGHGRLMDIRRLLWEGRWTSRLFDTKRWVRDLERAYWEAWRRWERGEGGDIWL